MAMSPVDRDGPPDGDFASYIERLGGSAARVPGRVEPSGRLADEAREALRRVADGARGARGARDGGDARSARAGQAANALRAVGRSAALRLSRWLAFGGVALIVVAVLELFPALSPLPGFTLLMLSFVLRRLATR